MKRWGIVGLLVLALMPLAASAQNYRRPGIPGQGGTDAIDAQLKTVRLEQKLNNAVPLDVAFKDEHGTPVKFGDYFGKKPIALVMIQYRCAMLCTEQMNVLIKSMKELKFTPGNEFDLLIVSIDPREGPALATEKKKNYLTEYGRPAAEKGWHWLTGTKESVDRLADAVGYHYVYDPRTDQYAHPDGVIVMTPEGKVARYFFRLEYPAQGLRLGLVEASRGKIGNPVDLIALLCYHYNPTTGKYGLALLGIMRLVGVATVLGLIFGIALARRREGSLRTATPGTLIEGDR